MVTLRGVRCEVELSSGIRTRTCSSLKGGIVISTNHAQAQVEINICNHSSQSIPAMPSPYSKDDAPDKPSDALQPYSPIRHLLVPHILYN